MILDGLRNEIDRVERLLLEGEAGVLDVQMRRKLWALVGAWRQTSKRLKTESGDHFFSCALALEEVLRDGEG